MLIAEGHREKEEEEEQFEPDRCVKRAAVHDDTAAPSSFAFGRDALGRLSFTLVVFSISP
jgi:hypothetical protein